MEIIVLCNTYEIDMQAALLRCSQEIYFSAAWYLSGCYILFIFHHLDQLKVCSSASPMTRNQQLPYVLSCVVMFELRHDGLYVQHSHHQSCCFGVRWLGLEHLPYEHCRARWIAGTSRWSVVLGCLLSLSFNLRLCLDIIHIHFAQTLHYA